MAFTPASAASAARSPVAVGHAHRPPPRDFTQSPMLVFYELTRACDLVCRHCRACAHPARHRHELTTAQARELIDQLTSFPQPPLLVLTGGDPFKRPDLVELVAYAARRGLKVALTPSSTPLVTAAALAELRDAGLSRLAVSVDGVDAATHDAMRGVPGSFLQALSILCDARDLGLSTQINTTLSQRNFHQIEAMADQFALFEIGMWSIFFLIPVGRGRSEPRLSADECEQAFERIWREAQRQRYAIKTTEAPHYRRYVLQHADHLPSFISSGAGQKPGPLASGVRDGNGIMFVSHVGQIFPAGFLPVTCGRFPRDNVVDVYQNHPTFVQLRNPDGFQGKCGQCEYRYVCGGSRSRAYAVSGELLGQEPDCNYIPEALRAAAG